MVADQRESPPGPPVYLKKLRDQLAAQVPISEFFAQPADIVAQILNLGLPAPSNQVTGRSGGLGKSEFVSSAATPRNCAGQVQSKCTLQRSLRCAEDNDRQWNGLSPGRSADAGGSGPTACGSR